MDQRFATAVTLQPQLSASPDTLDRLSVTGWRGGLAALVAGLVLSFLLFGYFVIYWRNADMDFMVIYNAFLTASRSIISITRPTSPSSR